MSNEEMLKEQIKLLERIVELKDVLIKELEKKASYTPYTYVGLEAPFTSGYVTISNTADTKSHCSTNINHPNNQNVTLTTQPANFCAELEWVTKTI